MRDKFKKLTSVAIAGTMAFATVALSACDKNYKGTKLDLPDGYASAEVTDNGGFAVKKGDYIYFINGQEDYTAENKYGEVTKGALMRIKASDLTSGNYEEAQTVVPMLFSAQNFNAGIYLYKDSVYFATPTSDKDLDGNVANDWIDFKSAKLDGSSTMKSNYFRLENNAVQYRFVEVNDVVYCLYVDGGNLYSYNTVDNELTTLVVGASSYYFDETDAENANVYYLMSVTNNIDSNNSSTFDYNQIYSVNAAATAKASEQDGKITYSVYPDGDESKTAYRTYSFDKEYLEEQNDEAKKNDQDKPYDFKDYATMPYVNLGTLVLDGIGSAAELNKKTQYNDVDAGTNENEPYGYTYAIQSYENGGLYFKRTRNTFGVAQKLYYVADETVANSAWKSVAGNASVTYITDDTTNATTDAVYYKTADGELAYIYIVDGKIVRVIGDEKVTMEESTTGASLWMVKDGYLYYTMAGTNGDTLLRINVNGEKQNYNRAWGDEEYFTSKFVFVDYNSAWYMPEIIDNVLLFSNAESFGSYSYNYVYAFNMNGENGLMKAAELNAINDKYDEANEKISEIAKSDADVEAVLNYVFRTGTVNEYEAIKDNEEYFDDDQKAKIQSFIDDTTASYRQSYFVNMLGSYKTEDADEIKQSWVDYITPDIAEEEEEDEGLEGWQIALIVVGSVLVVAGIAGAVAYYVISAKKKEEEKARASQVVNAYKKRIDVTDDKTVDVYSDEEETEATEEAETAETTEEVEAVEEVTEVAEETVEETEQQE